MAKKSRIGYNRALPTINTQSSEVAEVVDIIMSTSHSRYKIPSDIGAIVFRRINSDFKKNEIQLSIAHPMNLNVQSYPIKHEIVNIYESLVPKSSVIDQETGFYYSLPIATWGNVNGNPLPFSTQAVEIERSESVIDFTGNAISNSSNTIELGEYFTVNSDVPNLTPFEGDIMFIGRYGQSMRFGSSNTTKSTWTRKESDSPITIIRNSINGRGKSHIIEDINVDDSSIYMTVDQSIPLSMSYNKYSSFIGSSPKQTKDYSDSQIILNSDDIKLNSKKNNIQLTSKESVYIGATKSINFNSDDYIYIISDEIYLGNGAANKQEPMVLGNKTLTLFIDILNVLLKSTYVFAGAGAIPSPITITELTKILTQLSTQRQILSKTSYLK